MSYRIVAIAVTLRGHSPTASLLKCDFSYICAAVDNLTKFQLTYRGPSVLAKLLVSTGYRYHTSPSQTVSEQAAVQVIHCSHLCLGPVVNYGIRGTCTWQILEGAGMLFIHNISPQLA